LFSGVDGALFCDTYEVVAVAAGRGDGRLAVLVFLGGDVVVQACRVFWVAALVVLVCLVLRAGPAVDLVCPHPCDRDRRDVVALSGLFLGGVRQPSRV